MEALLSGIFFGLVLTILVGPLFFTLLQTGAEQGMKGGLMVGVGIWLSDFLYIVAVYVGVSYIIAITEWKGFEEYLGVIGGIVLVAFGLAAYFSKAPVMQKSDPSIKQSLPYFSLAAKGFLINTLNPFTVFFWISVMTTVVVKKGLTPGESFLFFAGILGTIMITDTLKVYLAKAISNRLKNKHILILRKISGAALVIFGVVLVIRVLFN